MTVKVPKKQREDWTAIERDYRANTLSNRELGRQYGISEKTIRNKAKELGWTRDLTDRIKEATKSALSRRKSAAEAPCGIAEKMTDEQIVEEKVAQAVHVVFGHRTRIGRMNSLVEKLMDQLDLASDTDTPIQALTSSAVNLSNALKTTIGLERQAFNIGDEPPQSADSLSALLDHIKTTGSRLPIKPQGDKQ
jgi:hypothetical protein